MSIFGPLVAATTSTVTVALASADLSVVTSAPSTSSSTGSSTDSPGSAWTRSISRTSPTETFSWRPPARTIAYTIGDTGSLSLRVLRDPREALGPRDQWARADEVLMGTEGPGYEPEPVPVKLSPPPQDPLD